MVEGQGQGGDLADGERALVHPGPFPGNVGLTGVMIDRQQA